MIFFGGLLENFKAGLYFKIIVGGPICGILELCWIQNLGFLSQLFYDSSMTQFRIHLVELQVNHPTDTSFGSVEDGSRVKLDWGIFEVRLTASSAHPHIQSSMIEHLFFFSIFLLNSNTNPRFFPFKRSSFPKASHPLLLPF